MPSKVVMDFENVDEQIVSAIKNSIEKVAEHVLNDKPADKKKETAAISTFNIREQILANAKMLWPISELKAPPLSTNTNSVASIPPMPVIVSGEGTTITAEFLCEVSGEENKNRKFIFLQGSVTHSAEKALQNLLEVSMVAVNKARSGNVFYEKGCTWNNMEKRGGYYEPLKDCTR